MRFFSRWQSSGNGGLAAVLFVDAGEEVGVGVADLGGYLVYFEMLMRGE